MALPFCGGRRRGFQFGTRHKADAWSLRENLHYRAQPCQAVIGIVNASIPCVARTASFVKINHSDLLADPNFNLIAESCKQFWEAKVMRIMLPIELDVATQERARLLYGSG